MKHTILKNSGFYTELNILLVALQGMGVASELILTGKVNHRPGDFLTIEAKHLDIQIRIPMVGPIQAALANTEPTLIEIEVIEGRKKGVDLLYATSGFQKFVDAIFLPFLVCYFEKYKHEITEKYSAGRDTWPNAWQMGWAIRNAASHNGRVFASKTAKAIFWRELTFSPHDEPHKNLLKLINGGDIFILMLEMESTKSSN